MVEGKMARLDRKMADDLAKRNIVGNSDTSRLLAPAFSWSEVNLDGDPF